MADYTPLINGRRHSWADVAITLLGRTVVGITGIAYDDKQEKVNNYGAGNFPVSRGRGKYEATAKITLQKYEVDAIQKTVGPGKRLQDIQPFDINVTYATEGSDKLTTDVIRNCEFLGRKRDVKTGDSEMTEEHDLIVSHIVWG